MSHRRLQDLLENEIPGMFETIRLSEHTTWRIGGPALSISVTGAEKLGEVLALLHREDVPWFVLGMGSNVLAPTEGTDVVILRLSGDLASTRFTRHANGWTVTAGGGASLPPLAGAACMLGASGLQFAVGIPGTVGGAVVMNAGAYGASVSDLIETVTVRHPSGERETIDAPRCGFGYRTSIFQNQAAVVESVTLVLAEDDPAGLRERASEILELRRKNYPLDKPSAGSVFRRPDEGSPPGYLIEQAGLKGFRIGGAEVSVRHANFIINNGGATSGDIAAIISAVREKVLGETGISLREEILYIPRGGEGSPG